jgi:predicted KAP-like P-loop ATPase
LKEERPAGKGAFLSSDKPLESPDSDRLGYSPFAKYLAKSINGMAPTEGFVISIHGSWGQGKSTMLNFLAYYLNEFEAEERPIIIRFCPWWFSGHDDLVQLFFKQLRESLLKSGTAKKLKKLGDRLSDLSYSLSQAPSPSIATLPWLISTCFKRKKDVRELKEKIAKELGKEKRRILIIVDDIDRLTSEEIRQLFKVIKAIADFPYVTYVLAFDKEIVEKAVGKLQDTSGEGYLGKIIQAPFELPAPDRSAIQALLFERLDLILRESDEPLDQIYWGNVYLEGLDPFIRTPRDIVRLTNTLSITFPAVKGEVNPVDFIAIEVLRIFLPIVYEVIRRNGRYFFGHSGNDGLRHDTDALKAFHEKWLESVPVELQEVVKDLLKRLFPKIEAVWGSGHYGYDWEAEWRKKCRICSEDIFPVYFRLAVPEQSISRKEMKSIFDEMSDVGAFSKRLEDMARHTYTDGTSEARIFLTNLEDYTRDEIPVENIPNLVQTLFRVGDIILLHDGESKGFLDFGNNIRISRVLAQTLKRLDELDRFQTLKNAIETGQATTTIASEVESQGRAHGKYGAKEWSEENTLLTLQHVEVLELLALSKIREAADSGSLIASPNLPGVLHCWLQWSEGDEIRAWVDRVTNDDDGLAYFLEQFLQKTRSQQLGDSVSRLSLRLDPRWIKPYIDIEHVMNRLSSINFDGLTEKQILAISQLRKEYEASKSGKSLDDFDYGIDAE